MEGKGVSWLAIDSQTQDKHGFSNMSKSVDGRSPDIPGQLPIKSYNVHICKDLDLICMMYVVVRISARSDTKRSAAGRSASE